jgi:hypothetical protein
MGKGIEKGIGKNCLELERNGFWANESLLLQNSDLAFGGVSMKTALAVVALLIACLLAAGCFAQSTRRFQSVGGDYGRSVISSLNASKSQPAANPSTATSNNSNSLWNWGSAPKGSMVQNGKLVADPYYYWKSLNLTNGWMGETQVDPYTGYPLYSYIDSNTGVTKTFYVDPYTGRPVYVERGANSNTPLYGSVSPFYSSNDWWGNYALPPVFNSNKPWS